MALIPAGQVAAAPEIEVFTGGPDTETHQYQQLMAVAESQENRLVAHAAIRKLPGYDLSDPWLVSNKSLGSYDKSVPGMPCRLRGSHEVVAVLDVSESRGVRKVRLPSGSVSEVDADRLMPLPTRPAKQGEWALPVALPPEQANWIGRRGLLGLAGVMKSHPGEEAFWVCFQPEDPSDPPNLVLILAENLVAVAGPSWGAPLTSWEKRAQDRRATRWQQDLPMLVDEGAQERQLAKILAEEARADDEDEEVAGEDSEDIEGSSGSEEPDEILIGGLVKVELPESRGKQFPQVAFGRLDRVSFNGTRAWVKLLGKTEDVNGKYHECASEDIELASRSELYAVACCSICGGVAPENELVICDQFSIACMGAAHIRCQQPPLEAVPTGSWFCACCAEARRQVARSEGQAKPGKGKSKTKTKQTAKAKPAPEPEASAKSSAKASAKSKSSSSAAKSSSSAAKSVKAKTKKKSGPKAKAKR